MNNNLYTTRNDAIDYEIVQAIEASGYVKNAYEEFDIDAIADDVLEYVDGWNDERGAYMLNKQGYRLAEDIDHDDFWASVKRHAK